VPVVTGVVFAAVEAVAIVPMATEVPSVVVVVGEKLVVFRKVVVVDGGDIVVLGVVVVVIEGIEVTAGLVALG